MSGAEFGGSEGNGVRVGANGAAVERGGRFLEGRRVRGRRFCVGLIIKFGETCVAYEMHSLTRKLD